MTERPAIETRRLTKRFGAFTAVDSVDLAVREGEIFGFLGPNGCGKSTTIRMLCGLLKPTSGEATVAGMDVRTQPERVRAVLGYVGQFFYLYGDLTVEENMDLYGGVYGVAPQALRERIEYWMGRLSLAEVRGTLAGSLSTGIQRRLSLACAVLHEPLVLLLDEPTSGVDPASRREFFEVIAELADKGTTVLVTTHVMDEAERCNRLALMNRGRLRALGTPGEIRTMSGGGYFRVATGAVREAAELAERHPKVLCAYPFGGDLEMQVTPENAESARAVAEWLREQGVDCGTPMPVRPTIEHTFVRRLGEEADEE